MGEIETGSANVYGYAADMRTGGSTANDPGRLPEPQTLAFIAVSNDDLDAIYLAVVESVEEAVLNGILAAESVTGKKGRIVEAIDADKLKALVLG